MRVETKIKQLRREFDGKTQAIRGSLLAELESLLEIAAEKARGTPGKGVAKEKRMWMHVAGYLAQTITYIANEYDASKIEARLDELERLLRELKAQKSGKSDQRD